MAKAALSARDGVFHVVAQTTTTQAGSRPTRVWTETWASADGRRSHSLIYDARPDGGRGRLVGETVGGGERTSEAVAYTRPRGGGALPASGEPAAERPHSYVLELLRRARVTAEEPVTYAGRKAWRLSIRTRVDVGFSEFEGARKSTPPYTRRTVLIVDGRSHLPLFLRTTGRITRGAAGKGRAVGLPRQTETKRFTRFERLTSAQAGARLEPSRRFRPGG